MFRTSPDAEVHIPPGLGSVGAQVWRWMELSLNIPCFLVTILHTENGEPTRERNLLLSDTHAVIQIAEDQTEGVKLIRVNLLSPGYLNGSGSYQLGQLDEIWEDDQTGEPLFVLTDGTRMKMTLFDVPEPERAYRKVFPIPVH